MRNLCMTTGMPTHPSLMIMADGAYSSIKYRAVEASILNGFEDVIALYSFGDGEIGDGAGDFEDAVVGAGGKRELLHRLLEQIAEGGVDRAVFGDVRMRHARI